MAGSGLGDLEQIEREVAEAPRPHNLPLYSAGHDLNLALQFSETYSREQHVTTHVYSDGWPGGNPEYNEPDYEGPCYWVYAFRVKTPGAFLVATDGRLTDEAAQSRGRGWL